LLSLLPRGAVQGSPTLARVVELARGAVDRPFEPAVIEPGGAGKLSTDRGEDGRRPITRVLFRGRRLGLRLEIREQLERRVLPIDVEHVTQRTAEAGARLCQPDRLDVRADEILVAEVDLRGSHLPRDHVLLASEVVLIV